MGKPFDIPGCYSDRRTNRARKKAKRVLEKPIRMLEIILDAAKTDATRLRNDLSPVMDDLTNARNHLARAVRIDRALASIQRELSKKTGNEEKTA